MVCSHCQRCLTPRTFASSVPATSGLQKSQHSQVLRTSSSSLKYLHNRLSIHLDPCRSREWCFEISVSSDKSDLHGKSIVPLPSASTSLTTVLRLRCCRVLTEGPHDSAQFLGGHRLHTVPSILHHSCARSGQEGSVFANVVTNATHNGCFVCPLHRRSQASRPALVFQHTTNQFHELSFRSRNNSSATMRGHVTGQVFLFFKPLRSARQLSRSWSQVYMSEQLDSCQTVVTRTTRRLETR